MTMPILRLELPQPGRLDDERAGAGRAGRALDQDLVDRLCGSGGGGEPDVDHPAPAVLAAVSVVLWRYLGADDEAVVLRLRAQSGSRVARLACRKDVLFADLVGAARAALTACQNAREPGSPSEDVDAGSDVPEFCLSTDAALGVDGPESPVVFRLCGGSPTELDVITDGVRVAAWCAEQLATQVHTVLENAAAQGACRIADLGAMRPREVDRLVRDFNRTTRDLPRLDVASLFERMVADGPQRRAVVGGRETVTYAELDARAERLHAELMRLGVSEASVVGVHLERSVEAIVAILAILKAGCAWVPLDPELPRSRIELMASDAGVRVIVTRNRWVTEALASYLAIDIDAVLERQQASSPRRAERDPNAPAYIMYTSGSSGHPKAVVIRNRNLLNMAVAHAERLGISSDSRVLQFFSLAFDASVFELFVPLLAGAAIILPPRESLLNPQELARIIREERVTSFQLPPSVLAELAPQSYPDLQTVLVGGEVYPPKLVDRWVEYARVVNFYGPTEACVSATSHERKRGTPGNLIGTPLANVRAYILDDEQRPQPVGVPGELYIGGAGVGAGYLKRPDLTRERFLDDPFAGAGQRMYRTGDRARYLPNGVIEFLGRQDTQVKVRGHRVELGEVEAALSALPCVKEAAVVLQSSASGDELVAFVVIREPTDISAVRAALAAKLPTYMVPSRVYPLDELPRLLNGKVDRRALDARSAELPTRLLAGSEAPSSWICAIFRDVIGCVGPADSSTLFELGGHSLHALRIASRIEEACGQRVSLEMLLGQTTLAELERSLPAPSMATPAATDGPPGEDDTGELPLSPGQRALWVATQATPSTAYSEPLAIELLGAVDLVALRAALVECVRRHVPLRTRVIVRDGDPIGVTDPAEAFAPRFLDLRALPQDEQTAGLHAAFERLASEPFDLGAEAPLRALIVRLDPDRSALCLIVHHIAADGWSYGVLSRDLSQFYRAQVGRDVASLPPLRTTYPQYARRQLARMNTASAPSDLDWWRSNMAGAPAMTRLPLDRPRPALRTDAGDRVRFCIDPEVASQLRRIGREHGASLFSVLAAALAILLARHGAEEDVTLGTVVANRSERALEDLVGYFANLLPLRIDLTAAASFGEAIERSARATVAGLEHGHVPFDHIVRALNPAREPGVSPLFQALLVLQDEQPQPLSVPGVRVRSLPLDVTSVKFDLLWDVVPQRDGSLHVSVEFHTDVFDRATIERLTQRWRRLLSNGGRDVGSHWRQLPMLEQIELEHLRQRARPQLRFDVAHTIGMLFREQAQRTPARIAVSDASAQLSYAELDVRTSLHAARLRALGAGPGVRVGLCFDRSVDLIVGVISVLKSGAAYVPIDPRYPIDRSTFIVRDSGAALMVCAAAFVDEMGRFGVPATTLDALETCSTHLAVAQAEARPEDVAYVIYTSGTTGHPKGTCVTHRNVVRLMYCARERFDFTESDVWTLFHSYAFDFSVWEMWGALLSGGRLVVVPHDVTRSPDAFHELLVREQVTVLCQTPSAFTGVQHRALRDRSELALRYVIMGGEALNMRGLRPWFERHGDSSPTVVNMYGITETTVHTTFRRVRLADTERDGSFIGEPLPDLGVALLGPAGEWVPDGAPGEIYVSGDGVAAGYLSRPDLNAQRFLQDPLHSGRRWYRSGDLARRHSNGDLEYLGRIDQQIKIRGFRVELGEVEACGQRHPAVRDIVVELRELSGSPGLVAWITPRSGAAQSVHEFLRAQLPEYMVPSRIIEVETLPLTATGKVDRKNLPLVQTAARAPLENRRLPATDLEKSVAQVWSDVLGVEDPGLHENFFDLGGHSLLATKLVMRIEDALGVSLPVRYAFEAPTVAALSELVGEMLAGRHERVCTDVEPHELLADAVLDDDIQPITSSSTRAPARILLTGATGFLGAYLLSELLRTTNAELWCLVRAPNERAAQDRLRENLDRYGRLPSGLDRRVRVVVGDLAAPLLGQSPGAFADLADIVESIVHVGAWVNFLEGYKRLRGANVCGTREVLRLACTGRTKAVHHISTTGVFGTPSYRERIDVIHEDDDIAIGLGVGHIGYVQTKWVAERLVWLAHARGVPVSVYRCGLMMGDSVSGCTNLRDFPSLMIKGCLQLGACYELRKLDNFIPVDVAASAIAHLIGKPATGRAYHVVNPHYLSLSEFWRLLRSAGCALESLPYHAWVERFLRQPGGPEANALYPLFSLFREKVPAAARSVIELFEDQPRYDLRNFLQGLSDSSIHCPPVDERLVSTWLEFYRRVGFLAQPTSVAPKAASSSRS